MGRKPINLLDGYKLYLEVEKEASNETIKTYMSSIKLFIKYKFKQTDEYLSREMFNSIDIKDFAKYKKYLMDEGKMGGTIVARLDGLISLYGFMEEEYRLDVDLSIIKLKKLKKQTTVIRKKKDTLSKEESQELLNYIKNDETKAFRERNYFLFSLFLAEGLRLSETLSLKEGDIDIERKVIIFSGETTKGNKPATLQMQDDLVEVYKEYMDWKKKSIYNKNDYIFFTRQDGEHLSTKQTQTILNEYLTALNIDQRKHITPHRLRGTVATLLNESGASLTDIQAQLRHSSPNTTACCYIDKNETTLKRVANMNPLSF